MESLLQDIRIAARRLLHSRMFALMAIGTLAIGLGANTAVFTLVSAIHLRPLPFATPNQLVDVYEHHPTEVCEGCGVGTSYANFADWQRTAHSFSAMAAYDEASAAIRINENAEKKYVSRVSAELFPLLGVAPLKGRYFTREEERAGGSTVAMISEQLAGRAFGEATAGVGRSIRVNGQQYTIVGIMPERFVFPARTDVWIPFPSAANTLRNDRSIGVVARLQDDVTIEQASAEMRGIGQTLAEQFPAEQKGWNVYLMSLQGDLTGDFAGEARLLISAVLCVLLIVCANLANLMLARTSIRRPELAVRAALGASRWQLARQMLVESMIISIAGGMAGMIIALWGVELLHKLAGDALPRWIRYDMDWRVFAYAFGLSTLTGLLFGLMPARFAAKSSVADVLKEGGRGASGVRRPLRIRDILVVAQVGVAFVLVASAGLLTKGVIRSNTLETGYDIAGLVGADLGASGPRYETPAGTADFTSRLLSEIELSRSVKSAAVSANHFLNWPGAPNQTITIDDVPADRSQTALHRVVGVTTRYMETIGLSIVSGRDLTGNDANAGVNSALISRTLAQNLWNDKPAVGKHVRIGNDDWTIVGVVSDVRGSPLGNGMSPLLYVPLERLTVRNPTGQPLSLSLRVQPGATSIPLVINRATAKADPDVTVENVASVEESLRLWTKPIRLVALTATVIGSFASLLAALGIYGLLAYIVSQRTHEIGIRMALGASVRDVVRLVMQHGVKLALAGIVVGIAGAGAFTQLLGSMLYNVSPLDPVVYLVVAMLFIGVALLAVFLPSRQASRVNPLDALRTD